MDYQFSDRIKNLKGNAIREIFKLLSTPGIVSFAGGFPAKETLPVDEIKEIADKVLTCHGAEILQYGGTEGYRPLIESAGEYVRRDGVTATPDQTLIVSGGQQGIDLTFKAFINKGDRVLVENPTYLAALHILKTYEGEAIGVDSDFDGINIVDLAKKIVLYSPKILYLVPNFSNPTGKTLSLEKREAIHAICKKHGVIILEDNPYGEIRFSGSPVPAIKSFDNDDGIVIYQTSFSKVIAPGLRTGVVVASPEIIRKLTIGKQASDVHTSSLSQAIIDMYLREGRIEPHLKEIVPIYKAKKDAMYDAITKFMPKGIRFTNPDGGLFIFAEFARKGVNTDEIFKDVVEKTNCAYVPGSSFFADGKTFNTFRLNYSNATTQQIEKGIKSLAEYFTKLLED